MEIKNINSYQELDSLLKPGTKSYLLLYKKGSEQSDCAMNHYNEASTKVQDVQLLAANVSEVRDIHEKYGISSAPTMIEFDGRELKNTVKGCHQASYFQSIIEDSFYTATAVKDGKAQKRVTVYSTPTCTWCNTLKTYLKENKIRYTDIDVSVNQAAAQEMVRKSGQQGVPQTDINGQIIVGFDKTRINTLLGING